MHEGSELVLEGELKKFQVLYELAVAMTAERSLEENLHLVVDRSRDLLNTDTSYIALRDEAAGDVYMHTLSGIRTEAFKMMRLPYGKGVGGLVAKTRQGLIVEDYFGERKISHVVDKIVADEGVISGMAVPIQIGSKNLGVLYVFNRTRTSFSQSDLDTLSLIGNLAAVEISRKRAEDSVRKGREELEAKVKERTSELEEANALLAREVLERKRSEEALRESENKFRDLFENVSDFIYFHDMEGVFLESNLAFRRAYGLSEQELGRIRVKDMMPPENRGLYEDYKRRVMEKGEDEGLLKVVTGRGTDLVMEYKNSLVRDSAGNPVGVRGSARDVTERMRSEKEKERLQAQLLSAQRIEAIGTLAGGIAHNFNNLLMGIQGNATLARLDVTPSSPAHQKLENIERLVRSGAKLTSQLLGYAREGRYEVRPISLNHLVNETSHTFAQARKDIRVQLDLEDSLGGIDADQGQIEQVLLNLLVNAADAMPAGGEVFLRTRNVTHREMTKKPYRPKKGKYALLEVMDTGVGMDGKTMERIFEPFFTTKAMGKGTGLGLASVYGIVKGHGGYIDVHSEKERGSTFQVYLPASERKIIGEKELPGGIAKGSGRILLVDDEEMILEVGAEMLDKLGYQVLVAGSGAEAVRIYRENRDGIDLVILDVVMPGMGGSETYDQLRRINPAVRVLLSSGYSIDGQAKETLDRGCDGFIQKPFNLQGLSEEVQRIMTQ